MKTTSKTKSLKVEVMNNETVDEFIKCTLTIKRKFITSLGYSVNTKVYQYNFYYSEYKTMYFALKSKVKAAITFAKFICEAYGELIN